MRVTSRAAEVLFKSPLIGIVPAMEPIERCRGNLWANVDVIGILLSMNRFCNSSYDEVDSQHYLPYKTRDLVSTHQ